MQGEINHFFKMKYYMSVVNGLVYNKDRLSITIKWRKNIMKLLNESHLGIVKTKPIAKKHFNG